MIDLGFYLKDQRKEATRNRGKDLNLKKITEVPRDIEEEDLIIGDKDQVEQVEIAQRYW